MKFWKTLTKLSLALSMVCLPVSAKEEKIETNTSPAVYKTLGDLFKHTEDYPEVKKLTADDYVIPGMKTTLSRSYFTKKPKACHNATPQGVTVMEDKVLISAYCHDHVHMSVLYVLDKGTGKLEKTLCLDGMPHVGSIAYDSSRDVVWVATHHDGQAAAQSVSASEINEAKNGELLPWKDTVILEGLPRTSYLTMDGSDLVAGTFEKAGHVHIRWYDLDRKKLKSEVDASVKSVQAGDNLQGMAITDGQILVSASDGPNLASTISVYSVEDKKLDKPEKTVELPPRAEQISVDGDVLLTCFEGGAAAYRKEGSVHVDRLLGLKLSDLL